MDKLEHISNEIILYFKMRERKIKCTAKQENDQFYKLYQLAKKNLK